MQCKQFVTVALLLMTHCQALDQCTTHLTLCPRGSGSRSPSSRDHDDAPGHESTGLLGDVVRQSIISSQPRTHESTGLLGDVVRQGTGRAAAGSHASHSVQSRPSQSSQSMQYGSAHLTHLAQGHSMHQLQSTQVHPAHLTHLEHNNPTHQLQGTPNQVQFPQGRQTGHVRPTRSRPGKAAGGLGSSSKPQSMPRLGQLAASLHSVPRTVRKPPVDDGLPRTRKHTQRSWWKRPGGAPPSQQGTGTHYEASKKAREKQKLKKQGKQLNEHPNWNPQHPSRGGGPGSPGAGSHAVSKRALEAT